MHVVTACTGTVYKYVCTIQMYTVLHVHCILFVCINKVTKWEQTKFDFKKQPHMYIYTY